FQLQTTLFEAINHGDDGAATADLFDATVELLLSGAGAVSLQYTVTRTDGDGDTIVKSDALNLITSGSSSFFFDDDGPTGSVAASTVKPLTALALNLDESVQPDGGTVPTYDRYNGAETESSGGTSNGGADDVDP